MARPGRRPSRSARRSSRCRARCWKRRSSGARVRGRRAAPWPAERWARRRSQLRRGPGRPSRRRTGCPSRSGRQVPKSDEDRHVPARRDACLELIATDASHGMKLATDAGDFAPPVEEYGRVRCDRPVWTLLGQVKRQSGCSSCACGQAPKVSRISLFSGTARREPDYSSQSPPTRSGWTGPARAGVPLRA